MSELIRMGGLELRFLQSAETGASLDMFEMTLQPDARMPVPHYHESWDEGFGGWDSWLKKSHHPTGGAGQDGIAPLEQG